MRPHFLLSKILLGFWPRAHLVGYMYWELTSIHSMGGIRGSNLWPFRHKGHTLATTPSWHRKMYSLITGVIKQLLKIWLTNLSHMFSILVLSKPVAAHRWDVTCLSCLFRLTYQNWFQMTDTIFQSKTNLSHCSVDDTFAMTLSRRSCFIYYTGSAVIL